jgi:hypothetical protein
MLLTMFLPVNSAIGHPLQGLGRTLLGADGESWTQQRLDGAALVHGSIAFGQVLERQLEKAP